MSLPSLPELAPLPPLPSFVLQPPTLISQQLSPAGYPLFIYRLGNGHRVVIEQRPTDIVSLRTFVNTGSINERAVFPSQLYAPKPHPSGIAHVDEHCHFVKTEGHPQSYTWKKEVESLGARYNASTGSELIQHELTFNREDLEQIISLHGDSVLRPVYDTPSLEAEKINVLNETGERFTSPLDAIQDKVLELLFERPNRQTFGKREDILQTTPDDLRRFHNQYYTPTNMLTVISGNVDPVKTLASIEKQFGSNFPRVKPDLEAGYQLALRPGEVRQDVIRSPQLTDSIVFIGFPGPSKRDIRDRIAMEVLNSLLGAGPLAWLETEIKNKRRLASSIEMGCEPTKTSGGVNIVLHTLPGQEKMAYQSVLQILQQVAQTPISVNQLNDLKNRLTHAYKGVLTDVEISTGILGEELLMQSLPYYLNYLQVLQSLTPQDLMRVAQQYLDPNRHVVVTGLPDKAPVIPGGLR